MGEEKPPSASKALDTWRTAERAAVRSTAQREAAELAVEAAELAAHAARETAEAADKASTAARVAAEASQRVLEAARTDADTKRVGERQALAAEVAAHDEHRAAVERTRQRYEPRG
jgi:hypothetical protein